MRGFFVTADMEVRKLQAKSRFGGFSSPPAMDSANPKPYCVLLLYHDRAPGYLNERQFMSDVTAETAPEPQKAPTPASAAASAVDLSQEIAHTVERRAGDQVKCTRISSDTYRCNWWSAYSNEDYDNPGMAGLLVTTHRVRMSRFLHVTKTGGKLVISDRSRARGAVATGPAM